MIQKYIALIRGINVGGNSKVSMSELKKSVESHGFTAVSTYINSGNVIFETEISDATALVATFEQMLLSDFGVNTRVAIISAEELKKAVKNAPVWWDSDVESKHNSIFVIPPASAESIMSEVGDIKPEYEKVAHYSNVIFWSAPLSTFSRTRWSNIVGTKSYKDITIRNANTTKKLSSLVD